MHALASILIALNVFEMMPLVPLTTVPPSDLTLHRASGVGQLHVILEERIDQTVPRGASRVPVLTVNASASCDANVTLNSMTLTHQGAGSIQDVKGVYAVIDAHRISRSVTADALSMKLTLPLKNFTIPACDSRRVHVMMDLTDSSTAGGEHHWSILSPQDISTSAAGVTLQAGDATSRTTISPVTRGIVTVRFLPIQSAAEFGRSSVYSRFQLTTDARSGHLFRSIVLTNMESARDRDIQDWSLSLPSGQVLTIPSPWMYGREVRLTLADPLFLPPSTTKTFLVKGTLRTSRRKTTRLVLLEDADIRTEPARSTP